MYNKTGSKILKKQKKTTYTINYAIIYILFNFGQDESQIFPLYFNGKYIYTMKNHKRLTYKIYSEGVLICERRHKRKIGPKTELLIENGHKYGIRIEEPYPQGIDPNKRFYLSSVTDSAAFKDFFENEFNGFKPFKINDIVLEENKSNPIIH